MNSFIEGAIMNIGGFDPVAHRKGVYSGWNSEWAATTKGVTKIAGTSSTGLGRVGRYAFSAAGPIGAAVSVGMGYSEEGLWGAAKWGVAEVVASGFMAASIAAGAGGIDMLATGIVGGIGAMIGGPGGYVAGTALGTSGLLGPLMPVMGAGVMTVGLTYLAAKGSWELLKAGYGHRQHMMRKIDTAGSQAAFMTKNAYTMRSRAIEAIRANHMNIKSALGQEAQSVHFNAYRKVSGSARYY